MQEIDLIASILNAIGQSKGNPYRESINEQYSTLKSILSGPNSISRRSKMSIFEYPVYVSNYFTNYELIAGVLKTLEIEYSRMLLLLFGINPSANFDQNYRIQQTLSTYHSNTNDYKFRLENAGYPESSLEVTFDRMRKGLTMEAGAGAGGIPIPPPQGGGGSKGKGGGRRRPAPPTVNVNVHGVGSQHKPVGGGLDHDNDDSERTRGVREVKIMDKYSTLFHFTVLEVNLLAGGSGDKEIKIPIGIRAAPHILPVDQIEYIVNSFLAPQSTSNFVNFYRWRAGEISFIELVSRYSEVKKDIEFDKMAGADAAWLKNLKQQANRHKANVVARIIAKIAGKDNFSANDVPPKTTYILNFANIDSIERETGINLFTNPNAASKFLDDSMGLSLVIIDESAKVAHILYSAYNKYRSYPLSAMLSSSTKEKDMTKILIDFMKNTM